jgi:hypothetical protein
MISVGRPFEHERNKKMRRAMRKHRMIERAVAADVSKQWNADDWHRYLSQLLDARANFPNALNTVALKIAEMIESITKRTPNKMESIS